MEWPASNFHSKRVTSNALCAGLHGGCEGVSQKGAQSFPSTNPSHWHFLLWKPLRFLIPATKTSPWPSSKWSSAVTNYIISNSTSSMLIKPKMKNLKREGGRDLTLVYRGTLPSCHFPLLQSSLPQCRPYPWGRVKIFLFISSITILLISIDGVVMTESFRIKNSTPDTSVLSEF